MATVQDLKAVDLNLLVVLDALLSHRSVTRAAQQLRMSAPAVSQALGRLRRTLDDPLLVRAGRDLVMSPRAEELAPIVGQLCHQLGEVFSPSTPFDPSTSQRTFTIVGSDYVISVLGIDLDHQLRADAPAVAVNLVPNQTDDGERVREGRADIAIGVYQTLPPEIRIVKLLDEELVVVARVDHPSIKSRLSLGHYCELEHIQIAPRGRPGSVVDDALMDAGHARRITRRVPFFFGGLAMASQSDRLLTLPRRLALRWAASFGLRVLKLPVPVDAYALHMAWHPRHDADAGHAWLRERIREVAKTKPQPRY